MPPCDFDYPLIPCYSEERFNPCFSGCRPATSLYPLFHPGILEVSILVLVDAALRPAWEMLDQAGV